MQYGSETLWIRLERQLENLFTRTVWYVLKASWRHLCKMSWRSFEDVLKTSSKRLEGVLKTSWRRPEDVLKMFLQDVLKTSWRRMTKTNILAFIKTSWKRLLKTYEYSEYVRLDQDIFWRRRRKTSSRRMFAGYVSERIA